MLTQTDTKAKQCFKQTESDILANSIGDFTLNHRHYHILLLSEPTRTVGGKASGEHQCQEITCFDIQGQSCVIVEAEIAPNQPNLAELLTERELQIATLVALGKVNKQIARKLHISEWTVSTYIRRIFAKLGVESRAAMVYHCASLIPQVVQQFLE
jgi:DNA-binding CsgD family transcriptional regulator